jgi:hypothetical protein
MVSSVSKIIVMTVLEGYDTTKHSAYNDQCGNQNGKPCISKLKHLPYPEAGKGEREEKAVNTEENVSYGMFGMLFVVVVLIVIHVSLLKVLLRVA